MSNNVYINHGREPKFPHLMHFMLTLATCGLWFPMWITCWLFGR